MDREPGMPLPVVSPSAGHGLATEQQRSLPDLRVTAEDEGLCFHPLPILSVLKKTRCSVRRGRRPVEVLSARRRRV